MARHGRHGLTILLRSIAWTAIVACAVFVQSTCLVANGQEAASNDLAITIEPSFDNQNTHPVIVKADEDFRAVVQLPKASPATDNTLSQAVRYQIVRIADQRVLSEQTITPDANAGDQSDEIRIRDSVKLNAGVYELRCQLIQQSGGFLARITGGSEPTTTASKPFVVASVPKRREQWTTLAEIRPTQRQMWRLPHWVANSRETSRKTVTVLRPNDTYTTALPRLAPNEPCRISLKYPTAQAIGVRIEVSSDETFSSVLKSVVFSDQLPVQDQDQTIRQSFLHYPSQARLYIRLTNITANSVSFDSVEIETAMTSDETDAKSESSQMETTPPSRMVLMDLEDPNWIAELTTDLNSLSAQSDRTEIAHRVVVATSRLNRYLDACGYTGVILPRTESNENDLTHVMLAAFNATGKSIFIRLGDGSAVPPSPADNETAPVSLANENQVNELASRFQDLESRWIRYKCYAGMATSLDSRLYRPVTQIDVDAIALQQIHFASQKTSNRTPTTPQQLQAWATNDGQPFIQQWCQRQSIQSLSQACASLRGNLILLGIASDTSADSKLITAAEIQTWSASASDALANTNSTSGLLITRLPANSISSSNHSPDAVDSFYEAIQRLPSTLIVRENNIGHQQWAHDWSDQIGHWSSIPRKSLLPIGPPSIASQSAKIYWHGGTNEGTLVATNSAPWTTEIQVQFNGPPTFQTKMASGSGTSNWNTQESVVRIKLAPRSLIVLQDASIQESSVAPLKVVNWTSNVIGGAASEQRIKQQVAYVIERIGQVSNARNYRALINGGFERGASVGIPGWIQSRGGDHNVSVDTTEAIEGKASIRIANQSRSAKSWIISESFSVPTTGRLAVSLACRAEANPQGTPARVRLAIEGLQGAESSTALRDFEIDSDGKWNPRTLMLEVSEINPNTPGPLRVVISSISPGRIWIDDVQVHDWFSTRSESTQLQSQAFLAMQGLQRNELGQAAQLLSNPWARDLLSRRKVTQSSQQKTVRQVSKPAKKKPIGVAERIKGWLPRPLRF